MKVVAVSVDPVEDARRAAEAFPRLQIIADPEGSLGQALGMIDRGALRPAAKEVYGPTQVIVDGAGRVESIWRGRTIAERRGVDEILAASRREAGED